MTIEVEKKLDEMELWLKTQTQLPQKIGKQTTKKRNKLITLKYINVLQNRSKFLKKFPHSTLT